MKKRQLTVNIRVFSGNSALSRHENVEYQFGKFLLSPARRQLDHIDSGPVAISGRAFDVLVCLVSNAGAPVSRRALLNAVWQDCVVDENNLSKAIASLRRALDDESIATVPRQGYQFVVPVQTLSSTPPEVPVSPPVSQELHHGAFRSRSTVWAGVIAAVLSATWIYLQFESQPATGPAEPATRATADEFYERGQEFLVSNLDPRALELATFEFRQALETNPNHIEAQIALAGALRMLANLSMDRDEANRFSEQAAIEYAYAANLAADSSAGLPLSIRQLMDTQDWAGAEAMLEAWRNMEPEAHMPLHLYGEFLQLVGHASAAADVLEHAHAIAPAHLPTIDALSLVHNSLGNSDRVLELHEHAKQQLGYSAIHAAPSFWTLLGNGLTTEARELNFDLISGRGIVSPGELLSATANRESPDLDVFNRMYFYSVLNLDNPAEGRAELERIFRDPTLDSTPDFLNFAMFAAYFGATGMSLDAIDRIAYADIALLSFIWTAHMAPVRRHPEFASILERLRLIEYWDLSQWPDFCERSRDGVVTCR